MRTLEEFFRRDSGRIEPLAQTLCLIGLLLALTLGPAFAPSRAQTPVQITPQLQELAQLYEKGYAAYDMGDLKAAEAFWQEGLQKSQALKEDLLASRFLGALGLVYKSRAQWQKALEYQTKALRLQEKGNSQEDIAGTLGRIGNLYRHLGDLEQATEYLAKSLALDEKLGDSKGIPESLTNLGNVYADLGRFEKALDCYGRAATLFEKAGRTLDVATSLVNLGNVHTDLGLLDKAVDEETKALHLIERQGTPDVLALVFNALGNVYRSLARFDKALDFYSRVLAFDEKGGNPQDIGGSLHNLSNVYTSLGQFDRALDYETRALANYEQSGNPGDIAISLSSLANDYSHLGQLEQARDCELRALALKEKLGNQQLIAYSLANLGGNYEGTGDLVKARDYKMKALALFEKLGNPQDIADILTDLSSVYLKRGQLEQARDYELRAVALKEKLGNPMNLGASLSNLAVLYQSLGNLKRAEAYYARALTNFEQVSQFAGEPAEVGSFQAQLYHFYARYASLLIQEKRPERAVEILERGRAQGLARQLALNQSSHNLDFSEQDRGQLQDLAAQGTAASHAIRSIQDKIQSVPPDSRAQFQQPLAEARSRQQEAERLYSTLVNRLYAQYPEFRRLSGRESLSFTRLEEALAGKHPDTLYLSWAVENREHTLVFALSAKSGIKSFRLQIGENALLQQVSDWRLAALGPGGRGIREDNASGQTVARKEQELARTLYTELLEPLEKAGLLKEERYKHLVIAGDGPLLELPFGALLDRNGKRLLERFSLSSAVSLTTLTWPRSERKPSKSLLCIADPMGKAGEALLAQQRGDGFVPLQFAREEGEAIYHMFDPATASLLSGSRADTETVCKAMGEYALLHFATHGMVDRQAGLFSTLILAAPPQSEEKYDTLLARDVVTMKLAAQLAVLSACQTGQGKSNSSDGLLGLAWAFQAAGCPSVVASLWQVDDAATGDLMTAFYRELKAGRRKDDALRTAMLGIRKDGKNHAKPYFWAAFQVIGDTTPLDLKGIGGK